MKFGMRGPPILFSILLALGLVLLAVAGYSVVETRSFLASVVAVEGTVIDLHRDHTDGAYFPVVRFRARTGETVEFRSSVGSKPPSYDQGETVTVLYDESDPYRAEIDSFFTLWFGVIFSGLIGLFFAGAGATYWWRRIARARRR